MQKDANLVMNGEMVGFSIVENCVNLKTTYKLKQVVKYY